MKPWAIYGISRKLTEKIKRSRYNTKSVAPILKKSLHVFPIDVSNDNSLNLEISALAAPQYNIHRFGIFFSDSPRHADILLVLGKVSKKMIEPLKETVNQLPEPFGVIVIDDNNPFGISARELNLKNIVAYFDKPLEANEILSVLLSVMEEGQ